MKTDKQKETKIILVDITIDRTPEKKPNKINPAILKAIQFITITIISWLIPEATITILTIKLVFILLESLNKNKS